MSYYGINYRRRKMVPQMVKVVLIIVLATLLIVSSYYAFSFGKKLFFSREMYVGSDENTVQLIDDFKTLSLSLEDVPRGAKVTSYGLGEKIDLTNERFYKISYESSNGEEITGYINSLNLVETYDEVVFEKDVYATANTYLASESNFYQLSDKVYKGEKLYITDFELNEDGSINWYKLGNQKKSGYCSGKYFDTNEDVALLNYDINDYFKQNDLLYLDFRPRLKSDFEKNPRNEDARAWYITFDNLHDIDRFVEEARKTRINTFVIDFKVSEGIVYESETVNKLASETKNLTGFGEKSFKEIIDYIEESGFYTVARIQVFKDQGYAKSNPDHVIKYLDSKEPFKDGYDNIYLSPFIREVWSYNLQIAEEAVALGFNEIMFDYNRFPNVKKSVDEKLNYYNSYNEKKEEAIQQFSMYIYDRISLTETYVSTTTLGQVGYYVKSDGLMHGQQWHVLSNVYDYVYPYFFVENYTSSFLSGKSPFKYQYDMIYLLSRVANELNSKLTRGAQIRPIIQSYNNWGYANWKNIDAEHLQRQIQAIYDNNNKGFIAWTPDTTIDKYLYADRIEAFKIDYYKQEYSGSFK